MFKTSLKLKQIILKISNLLNKLYRNYKKYSLIPYKIELIQEALGRIERRQCLNKDFYSSEFKVFSQWGEDGLIQFLINNINIEKKIFVEFGVENYKESNTRFLMINDYWEGLVIDGSKKNVEMIKKDKISWGRNLTAISSFITRENINKLLKDNNICGDIGLLSIDIDGNDYWVWEEISVVNPCIVIIEYNSQFGPYAKVSTPYIEDFVRGRNNKPITLYGASLSALTNLGMKKGYSLVGSNIAGNNAFFVREDLVKDMKVLSPAQAYKKACFRESKEIINGNLKYKSIEERYKDICSYQIFNFETNSLEYISNLNLLNPNNF